MDDPVLQDISFDPNSLPTQDVNIASDPSTDWAGLDTVGSGTANVASSVLSSFGNLVSAQINKTALLTATGAVGKSNTAAPTANPNAWKTYLLIGIVIVAGVGLFHASRKA
ncbi:MAG: hypothetical protein ACRETD_02965 [Steroidobacteraceae bacterium]